MLTSPRLSVLLGIATFWMPVYMLAFMAFVVTTMLTTGSSRDGDDPPTGFLVLMALHIFTILLTFALLAVYLIDVFRNPDLAERQDLRTVWAILVIVLGMFAMPVYWWLYLRPGSDPFRRRQPQPHG